MKGYFSHIVNRSRGFQKGVKQLNPLPSRNPFMFRDGGRNAFEKESDALSTRSPESNASTVFMTREQKPDPHRPETGPVSPAFTPLMPDRSMEHQQPKGPGQFFTPKPETEKNRPYVRPLSKPLEVADFGRKTTSRTEGEERREEKMEKLLPHEGQETSPGRTFSIRHSIEKTEKILKVPSREEPENLLGRPAKKEEKTSSQQELLPVPSVEAKVSGKADTPNGIPHLKPTAKPQPVYKQPGSKKEQAPKKLTIGKLTVEVIQQQPPSVTTESRPNRERRSGTKISSSENNHRFKLKFGLGQL